jgi:phytanoyl-CoA hydroxylase
MKEYSEEMANVMRERASKVFEELEKNMSSSTECMSWLHRTPLPSSCSRQIRFFHKHGFLLIPSFASCNEVSNMKAEMQRLVDEEWDCQNHTKVFRTDDKQIEEQGRSDYFLESANKVHFFAESRAMDGNGKLKEEFLSNRINALNKVGHGLHILPESSFHNYTMSDKVCKLVTDLDWKDPVVPQSMYIFKQARVGGEVTSHQDSTFLYTTPRQTCLGLWLALDDTTIHNGCLWARPGSHNEKTRRKFARNIEHFGEKAIRDRSNIALGDMTKSQMVFQTENGVEQIEWEGKIPGGSDNAWDSLSSAGFVPLECKAGDLIVFCGTLDHLSLPNTSDRQRHTFQLHLIEGEKAGVSWADSNWLQYPSDMSFLRLVRET